MRPIQRMTNYALRSAIDLARVNSNGQLTTEYQAELNLRVAAMTLELQRRQVQRHNSARVKMGLRAL